MAARDLATAKTVAVFHKVTVYVHGATGSYLGYQWFEAAKVTFQKLRYSDFESAILVKAVPRGKRSERSYVETDSASTVVIDGWHRLDFPAPYEEDGRTRYSAFDERWDSDFAAWLDGHARAARLKILADLRDHDPRRRRSRVAPSDTDLIHPNWDLASIEGAAGNATEVRTTPEMFSEGGSIEITLTRYERDPAARAACLAHYGYSCVVCTFDFERVYGPLGRSFIHVHHIEPLSATQEEHVVDPIADLRPICPNCHAMLHRRKPPLTPAALAVIRKRHEVGGPR